MFAQTKQATSAKTSLAYLTIGALTVVWSVIYYLYLRRTGAAELAFLWCYGFFFSGIVLAVIGLAVGHIGRSAMQAEVAPPPNVTFTQAPPVVTPVAAAPTVSGGATTQSLAAAGTVPAAPVLPAEARR